MKIANLTEMDSLEKTLVSDYPAPGWILAYMGTILTFVVIMTIICHKYWHGTYYPRTEILKLFLAIIKAQLEYEFQPTCLLK